MSADKPNRFRGMVPSRPVDIQPLTDHERSMRTLYGRLTGGPVPDHYGRKQKPREGSKARLESKKRTKEREEFAAKGFYETRPGSGIWVNPGVSRRNS